MAALHALPLKRRATWRLEGSLASSLRRLAEAAKAAFVRGRAAHLFYRKSRSLGTASIQSAHRGRGGSLRAAMPDRSANREDLRAQLRTPILAETELDFQVCSAPAFANKAFRMSLLRGLFAGCLRLVPRGKKVLRQKRKVY